MDIISSVKQLVDAVAALPVSDIQAGLDQLSKDSHDQGFKEGVASIVINPLLVHTQEDLDNAVKGVVGPLHDRITELQAQVIAIPGEISSAVAQAVLDLKAKLKNTLSSQDADAQAKIDAL